MEHLPAPLPSRVLVPGVPPPPSAVDAYGFTVARVSKPPAQPRPRSSCAPAAAAPRPPPPPAAAAEATAASAALTGPGAGVPVDQGSLTAALLAPLRRAPDTPTAGSPTAPFTPRAPLLPFRPRSVASKFRGVSCYKRTGRWESHIWSHGKQAARAYDCAAVCFRGYGAELNFEEGDYRDNKVLSKHCAEDTTEEFIDWLRKGGKRGSLFAAADETEAGGTGAADGGNGAADSAPPPTPKPKPGADTAESGGGDGAGGCDGPPQPPPAKRVATGGDGAAAPAAGCGQAPPSFASSIRPVAPTVAQAYTSALAGGGVVAVATPGDDGEPVLVHSPRAPFHHSDERADASPRELGDSPSSGEGGGCGAGGEAGPEAAAAAAEGAGVAAAAAAEPPAGSPGAAEDEAEGCSPAGLCDVTQSERELVEALALSFMGQ